MRRILFSLCLIVGLVGSWATPATATHNPCDPAGPICIRFACPPAPGPGWFWLDHHGFPAFDLTHCAIP